MRYRHWLLLAAAIPLLFCFVFIRLDFLITSIYPTYGESDIRASTDLAIALLIAWLALEITHFLRVGSRGKCECGYSLKGVKCPECGRDQGAGPA